MTAATPRPMGWACRPHTHPGHHQVGVSGRVVLGPPSPSSDGTPNLPHLGSASPIGVTESSPRAQPHGVRLIRQHSSRGKARSYWGPRGWRQSGRLTSGGPAADCLRLHGRLPASSRPPSTLGLAQGGAQGHTSSLTASWTSAVTNTDVRWSPGVSQLRTLCLHLWARWTWARESGSRVT